MITALQILVAVLLDRWLGEPRRWHPLVGFGQLAGGIERRLNRGNGRRGRGCLALLVAVVPPTLLAAALSRLPEWPALAAGTVLLWLALGGRSLGEHARQVADALTAGDLDGARQRVGLMVSRDTRGLDAAGVSRAAVESVLENGNDAVFGALFWFLVAGPAGVVAYRLTNTLDAMWGYRNERFRNFGTCAARLDDLLNWLPARLTALAYGLAGRTAGALRCWRRQAGAWTGINPGGGMAAGAGALGLRLGGPAVYHGREVTRPPLGTGAVPDAAAIGRSLRLFHRALALWLLAILAGGLLLA